MSAVLTQTARLYLLRLELPGMPSGTAGVLLEDPVTNVVHIRLRRDWELVLPAGLQEEAAVLGELQYDLESKAAELGAGPLLRHLQDSLSNLLRISDPQPVLVDNFTRALDRHYRQHVSSLPQPYKTHLPRYSLAVAAGKFLENHDVVEEGWEEAPEGLRLSRDMFVARIVGRSMEPRIPDGSLCVFRQGVSGSRQGKLVLVEYLDGGANDRYTVKRYSSEKARSEAGEWTHQRVHLEPLNPEFEAWDLDPQEDRFRVVAEFVQVLAG